MDKLYTWDKQLASVLMLSFFLPLRVQVFVMIPVCLFLAIRDMIVLKGAVKRPYKYALLAGSIYLLYVVYLPFTHPPYRQDLLFNLEQKASLLLLPLIFCLVRQQTRKTILNQLHFFIIGCLLSCILANGAFLISSLAASSSTSTGLPGHVIYRRTFESISGIHPTYMGMYLCFSVAILLFNNDLKYRLRKEVLALLLFLHFIFLLALLPKTPLIALFVVLGYYCITQFRHRVKWIIPVVVLCLSMLIAYLVIPSSNERMIEMKGFSANAIAAANPTTNSISMRQLIWKVDTHLLHQHWLTGVGPGQMKETLAKQYFGLSMLVGIPLDYFDTHNEYLNIWLSFGLTGIVLFLFILLFQLARAFRLRAHLYTCLMLLLMICFTTENILANQHGIVFYSFFTSLFLFVTTRDVDSC